MATRALQQYVYYQAWNTSTNAQVTGDSGNHTLYWTKDNTASATTNGANEVSSAHFPGLYSCLMTSTETDCIEGALGGKSSTSNVVLIPTMVAFDYLNTSAPATAGIPDVNAKNINNATAVNGLTAAAIATGVWTDTTAGDFTTALSVGKSVMNGVSLGTGLTINGYTGNTPQTGDVFAQLPTHFSSMAIDASGNVSLSAAELNSIADALLNRDMAAGTDTNTHSPRNALRFLRNTWSISGTTLTVTKEDQVTSAWTATVGTTPGVNPITSNTAT